MHNQKDDTHLDCRAGPYAARGKDDPVGVDYIGLPSGIQPGKAGKLDPFASAPEKIRQRQ